MRIPITKYGLPQAAVYPFGMAAVMATYALVFWRTFPHRMHSGTGLWLAGILPEAILGIILLWMLSFFRDPARKVPEDPALLVAPADGTIHDIEEVREPALGPNPVLRIGIFLSVFNVHINRMPCTVRIKTILYKPGKFINAMHKDSGKVNESNSLVLERMGTPADRLLVRQISGAIARRIICAAREGQTFTAGQKFGMIKFGSRTELYLPVRDNARLLVQVGDKVKAGLTPLVRYEI